MRNLDKLISSVAGILDVSADIINENSSRDNVLQWDSLAMVDLITELEILFGVQFDILEIAEFNSVKNIKISLEDKGVSFK